MFEYEEFEAVLKRANTILYLGDNAGEIVCDKILIEEIQRNFEAKTIFFAVRGFPIINDVLLEDAYECGMDKTATVISNGSDAPGTILEDCSQKFLEIYHFADMIISKGQGNFETLSDREECLFFLLRAKCPVITVDINCSIGDTVLIKNKVASVT